MSPGRPDSTEDDPQTTAVPLRAVATGGSLTLVFESGRPCSLPAVPLGDVDAVTLARASGPRAALSATLGDHRQLTLELEDRRMSLVHARLRRVSRGWALEDAGSKNGTRVNGQDVHQATLKPGDLIEVGRSFLVYRDDAARAFAGDGAAGLATANPPLAQQFEKLRALARSSVAIVISGETGTGKEVVARAVHELSGRSGPLRAVNCGALPRTLLESELFGYRKGAFSGALEDRPGLIRSTDKGTLFLDEIGDLPLDAQAALLRVLQEGEVLPVGGVKPVTVDVRVIAATHRDLARMVERDKFRADLLARLSGFTVALPPLRDRREDLGALVGRLVERHAPERASSIELSAPAIRALHAHAWPANIRELEKVITTALVLSAGGTIELPHLPESLSHGTSIDGSPGDATSHSAATGLRERLALLLARHEGNVSVVAAQLKTSRSHVHRLCRRFGIDVAAHRPKS